MNIFDSNVPRFCGDVTDIVIVQGNDYPPAAWQFLVTDDPQTLFSLEGSQFYLNVKWRDGSIVCNTVDNPAEIAIDLENSVVAWSYSIAQSRLLPLGRLARYELERRASGKQQTLAKGRFIVTEGINND